ncbi:hemerythrin domain-containing protein [Frankia canadensis]|nr:hemerythrin domain-containing protein [Frankia canadensis]
MTTAMDGPADTRIMGVVHDALRRDLRRVRAALTTHPYPDGPRRAALAAHVDWMIAFLERHHGGEDAGLYPLVRATASPDAAELIDAMGADHEAIHPAMNATAHAARRWARSDALGSRDELSSDAARRGLVEALDELIAVLFPHLDREEAEAMPLVAATLTHRQWHEWDQTYNIKIKSLPELAEEGHWLLDGLEPERREIVLGQVPLIPRLIVLYGFGARYRRHASARWGSAATSATSATEASASAESAVATSRAPAPRPVDREQPGDARARASR